jgi:hypothetical protein
VPSEARSVGGNGDPGGHSAGSALVHAWSVLDRDRRLAAIAAIALFAAMFLPWYQRNAVVSAVKTERLVSSNLNAFQVFSFVEAAVLLVAAAVLFLLFERAEGKSFHLPGGDGGVVLAAGLWCALLLVLRLFDKPSVTQHGVAANVGVQWGIFFALAAAGLLAYAGSMMRAGQRPEPPLMRRRARTPPRSTPPRRPPEPPELEEDATVVVSRRESAPRDGPAPAREHGAGVAPGASGAAGRGAATGAGTPPPGANGAHLPKRGRYPPAPGAEQLSFEDPPDLPLR